MMGAEYSNGRGEETFSSSAGILKFHDILISLIPSQKMNEQAIDRGSNLVYGPNWTISFCNNGLGSPGLNIFV